MANYFNEDQVHAWVVEYLSFQDRAAPEALRIKNKIFLEVSKVINGIIFCHHFTNYECYDDCFQEATLACLKALDKFDPSYITTKGVPATTFNYFSLVSKRALKYYTIRNQRNRLTADIDESPDLSYPEATDTDWLPAFIGQCRRHLRCSAKKYMIPCLDILEDFLKAETYHKRRFFAYMSSFGFSAHYTRRFLAEIKNIQQ